MGVLTACAGGIIRDVLAGEPSILMRPELYITAAALSAGLFVGPALLGVSGFSLRPLRRSSPGSHCAAFAIAPWLVATGLSRLGLPHCSIAA